MTKKIIKMTLKQRLGAWWARRRGRPYLVISSVEWVPYDKEEKAE